MLRVVPQRGHRVPVVVVHHLLVGCLVAGMTRQRSCAAIGGHAARHPGRNVTIRRRRPRVVAALVVDRLGHEPVHLSPVPLPQLRIVIMREIAQGIVVATQSLRIGAIRIRRQQDRRNRVHLRRVARRMEARLARRIGRMWIRTKVVVKRCVLLEDHHDMPNRSEAAALRPRDIRPPRLARGPSSARTPVQERYANQNRDSHRADDYAPPHTSLSPHANCGASRQRYHATDQAVNPTKMCLYRARTQPQTQRREQLPDPPKGMRATRARRASARPSKQQPGRRDCVRRHGRRASTTLRDRIRLRGGVGRRGPRRRPPASSQRRAPTAQTIPFVFSPAQS